jgi:cytochrome P450
MTEPIELAAKPSDFARDERFRDPATPPFRDDDGTYHVFSHADVMRVLMNRDSAFSREPSPWLPAGPHHIALDFMWAIEPFTLSGEEGRHDALRQVVEPWFRTRAVRTMEPVIRELATELVDEIVDEGTGEFELASQLAYRLSMRVICRLTGIELDREHWMREKLNEFAQAGSYEDLPLQWDVQAYFWQMVAKRLVNPRDELLDVLVGAWREGTIDDVELLGYIYGFVTAGTDTTGTHFANAFTLLAEFELLDYAREVLDDKDALRALVEEVLRFGTPFPTKPLYVAKDTRFGDLEVPAGSVLQIWFSAANRDEAINGGAEQSSPMEFDPKRWPNRHVGLGWARHFCLGADLARLESRILLQEALRPPRPVDGRDQAVQALRRGRRRRLRGPLPVRQRRGRGGREGGAACLRPWTCSSRAPSSRWTSAGESFATGPWRSGETGSWPWTRPRTCARDTSRRAGSAAPAGSSSRG